MKTLIKIDKNGSKHYIEDTCPRCNGTGRYGTYGKCFKCNGTGKFETEIIERTPEYEKKLADRRLKKAEERFQKEIEQAPETNAKFFSSMGLDKEGNAYIVLGNTYPIKDELKAKGARFNPILGWYFDNKPYDYPSEILERNSYMVKLPNDTYTIDWSKAEKEVKKMKDEYKEYSKPVSYSMWVGNVGEKFSGKLKLQNIYRFASTFGDMGIYKFVDKNENVFVWKTSFRYDLEADRYYNVTGTIKDHSEYKGEKQTILTRCKCE